MRWQRIDKESTVWPTEGGYRDWKEMLREEGGYRCVYCCIPEPSFGGYRNFHVEHFRPKKPFVDRVNDYGNLFYACAVCNAFKSNDWPAEPDRETPSYLDPSQVDLDDVFSVDGDGMVAGNCVAAKYMVERLNLNRRQLQFERIEAELRNRIEYLRGELAKMRKGPGRFPNSAMHRLQDLTDRLADLLSHPPLPYQPKDLQRG